jgi:hypothetical protein
MACALFGFLSFVLRVEACLIHSKRMDRALKDLEDKQNSKKESVCSFVHLSLLFCFVFGLDWSPGPKEPRCAVSSL